MPEAVATRPPDVVPAPAGHARRPGGATAALVALMLAAGIMLLYAGRHLTFFYDEWSFLFTRRGSSVGSYLDPHNGHLSLFPVAVYKLLFAVVGLRHYSPYRVVGVALHLLCAALLYVLARRRIGPWPALVPTILLLFMGKAFQDLLWPFQIGYLGSIAGGLGALVLLDRPGAARDPWAAVLLVWSVVSSGVGLAFIVACGTLLVAQRAPWRRLWVVLVPLVLYGAWYVGWGGGDHTSSDAVLSAPQYVADAAAGAVAGIAGLNDASWGPPLAVALLALVFLEWNATRRRPPSPMLLTAAAGALVFWVLAAIARADAAEPAASRYLYVGAVFILLAVSEARVGLRLRGAWLGLAGLLVLGAVVGNTAALRAGERGLRSSDASVRASLGAVEVGAPVVSPAFVPDPINAPQVTAGLYLAAVRDLGSPAFTVAQLQRAPEATRQEADGVLQHAEELGTTPATGGASAGGSLAVEAAFGGRLSARGACEELTPNGSVASLDLRMYPGSAVTVQPQAGATSSLYLRRFALSFTGAPLTTLAGGRKSELRLPFDRAPQLPWHLQIVTSRPAAVCPAR